MPASQPGRPDPCRRKWGSSGNHRSCARAPCSTPSSCHPLPGRGPDRGRGRARDGRRRLAARAARRLRGARHAQPGGRREHRRQPHRTRGERALAGAGRRRDGARADLELPDHRDRAHRLDRGADPRGQRHHGTGLDPRRHRRRRRLAGPGDQRRVGEVDHVRHRVPQHRPLAHGHGLGAGRLGQPGDQPQHTGGPGRGRGLVARQRLGGEVGCRHHVDAAGRHHPAHHRDHHGVRQGVPDRRRLRGPGGHRHGSRAHRHHQHLGQPQCAVLGRGEPRGRRQPPAGGGLLVQLRRLRVQLRRYRLQRPRRQPADLQLDLR